MIKIAFCDDDMEVLHQMNELLDRYRVERNEDITYAAFQSPFELLTEIEKGIRPDILFLDVVMPGQNGMDVAKEIRQYDTNMKIIFLTSSPEFAVEFLPVETDLGGKLFPADGCGAGTKTFISSGKRSSSGKRRESG